jgi:hypothetical protein
MAKKQRGAGKIRTVLHEFKGGQLHSGSPHGPVVHSRQQAIAIAMSEARRARTSGLYT